MNSLNSFIFDNLKLERLLFSLFNIYIYLFIKQIIVQFVLIKLEYGISLFSFNFGLVGIFIHFVFMILE